MYTSKICSAKSISNILICLILFYSCTKQNKEVVLHQDIYKIDSAKIGKIKTVLILGNSIVRHPPNLSIGWNYNWGMAASSLDSDFVHLLIKEIHNKNKDVKVAYENIAAFENNYNNFLFSELDTFALLKPDMIIMRLSENVSDSSGKSFIKKYEDLINYIDREKKAVRIITDGFWEKNNVNEMIYHYALDNNYLFVCITTVGVKKENRALGQFAHSGVAIHPGNKGMKEIKIKIWNAIKPYF